MHRLEIRVATTGEVDTIASILRRSFGEHEHQYTQDGYRATVSPDIAQRLREGEILLAFQNGNAVGTVSVTVQPHGVLIRSMAIVPEARGLGIADGLLVRVEQFARAHGARRLHLQTTPFLLRAIRCYERFGFARSQDPPSDLFGTPLFTMEKRV